MEESFPVEKSISDPYVHVVYKLYKIFQINSQRYEYSILSVECLGTLIKLNMFKANVAQCDFLATGFTSVLLDKLQVGCSV